MIKGWHKVEGTYDFNGETVVVKNAVTTKRMLFDEQKADMSVGEYNFEIHVSLKNNHIHYVAVEVDEKLPKVKGIDGLQNFRRPYDFILTIYIKIRSMIYTQETIRKISSLGG